MLSLPLKRFAIVRIGVHALALLSGVVALVGLAQTTVEKGSEETSRRTAMGYLGACWVIVFNGIDISAMLYGFKTGAPPKRLPVYCYVAQHLLAMGLTIGGGILMLIPGDGSHGEWGGWDSWTAMAFVLLILAAGFHYALFVWDLAEMVLPRLRGDSVNESAKSARTSDDSP